MTSFVDWFMAGSMIEASNIVRHDQNVSRETFSLLTNYVNLLLKWNSKINLIGPMTEPAIWSRHIDDSLQLVEHLPETATNLVDLGSGAGLPGLVIAIARPDLAATLVEQDQRKAAFLNEAKRVLALSNVTVEAKNITEIKGAFDVVTARALAPLSQLLSYAKPLLRGNQSFCLFPKGENHAAELTEARQTWQFVNQNFPSKTNAQSAIVTVAQLQPLA